MGITHVLVIVLLFLASVGYARECSLSCANNCAKCKGLKTLADGTKEATIDLQACKGGDTLSWMCCRTAGCTRKICNGEEDTETNKCDEVTYTTYTVASTTTAITVQYHDGALSGTVDCSTGACCGGSGTSCTNAGTVSGVCNQVIDLSTCPSSNTEPPIPDCTADSDCPSPSACGIGKCTNGKCSVVASPTSTVCRPSAGPCDEAEHCDGVNLNCPADKFNTGKTCRESAGACDVAETCDGTSAECPVDAFQPTSHECRAADGPCDVAEHCTGSTALCPADSFLPATTVCRATAGDCDIEEKCTGSAAACPADELKPATHVCRNAQGVCDVAESCTGNSASCPADAFKPATHVCRNAEIAADGTTCDVEEKCTGTGVSCPEDGVLPAGSVCREKADLCDVEEKCTGTKACPTVDLRKDDGYVFKCSTTCYVCAVNGNELETKKGGAFHLGGCGIGKCRDVVALSWPNCVDMCIAPVCQNNRGLSNAEFFKCQKDDGSWSCTEKFEGGAVVNGVCPPWRA